MEHNMTGNSNDSTTPPVDVVIMAAGKGTRMKSKLPKVLHQLAGRPLVQHVVDTAAALSARQVTVITGHGADEVEAALKASNHGAFVLNFVRQEPQLGTGHAVQQTVPVLQDDGVVVVLSGDVPLTQADTLQQLIAASACTQLALLTIDFANPTGYGRIVRSGDAVQAIVEQKDATPEQLAITEVYSGIMAVPALQLKRWLARLDNHNAQGEYYLTQIVAFAVADGVPVVAHKITDAVQVAGVNSPVQLAELERAYQQRLAVQLMEQGVRLADPARLDVRGQLHCAQDVSIDVNCVFEGEVSLGEGVRVGANCVIGNASIAAGAVIHPFTLIEGGKPGSKDAVEVGAGALIGPFARLRPGARLGGGGAHRQFCRGQELHAGQRCQGQPPGLSGRRHAGRARQLRCRLHHRQLRRRLQAPHHHRSRCPHWQQLRADSARDHRRWWHGRGRLDADQRHRAAGPDRGARAPDQYPELEAAKQVNARSLGGRAV
jgi:bifunctional UDP-N-acetylglucosamine pyrophosphorylase/glucosamine-1-phosphate N-acetyltransferase